MARACESRLPAEPLRRWLSERVERYGRVAVAERAGVSPKRIASVLACEHDTVALDFADRVVTHFDDGTLLEDVWPDLDSYLAENFDDAGHKLPARRGRPAKLTDGQLRAAYRLYEAGMSLSELARRGWRPWGYASRAAARKALWSGFARLGLPLRDRDEAHRRCRCERQIGGRRCRAWAVRGGRFCRHHDGPAAGNPNS